MLGKLLLTAVVLAAIHGTSAQGDPGPNMKGGTFLLVADFSTWDILQVDVTSGSTFSLPLGLVGRPGALTYDPHTDYVYWADGTNFVIKRARRDGSGKETIIDNGDRNRTMGLALDNAGENIYWSVHESYTISVAKADGSSARTLLTRPAIRRPGDLALDPRNGLMYWGDWDNRRIQRAAMDGSDQTTIITGLDRPNGITIDYSEDRLYYSDAGNIYSSDLLGNDIRHLVNETKEIRYIAVDEKYVYWSASGKIGKLSKSDGTKTVLVDGLNNPQGIYMVTASPDASTVCFTPSTGDQYQYNWDIDLLTRTTIEFKVKANNDAFVALSSQNQELSDMYEILIGGWGNTQSVIRRSPLGPNLVEVPTPDILSPTEHRTFWITWSSDGTISVGRTSSLQPFMQWTDSHPLPIHYVGYSTGWGSNGEWIFCGVCVTLSTDDQYQYNWEFSRLTRTILEFEVKANNDAFVALSSQNQELPDMYEIDIGGYGDTLSIIRRKKQGTPKVTASTPDILSPSNYRTFWIRWSADGTIEVGVGGALQPFMLWKDPDPLPIHYFGYTTGFGSSGQWKFCAACSGDIVFVLDMSSSIQQDQFALARDFLIYFNEGSSVQGHDIRIGVILYNCVPWTYFDLGKYTLNSQGMLAAINNLMYKGGETRTGLAIRYMRATSDFRDDVPRTAFIMTDGQANAGHDYAYEAEQARAAGIYLYTVEVGDPALVDRSAHGRIITPNGWRTFKVPQNHAYNAGRHFMQNECGIQVYP